MCAQPGPLGAGRHQVGGPEGQASLASTTLFTSPHQEGPPTCCPLTRQPSQEGAQWAQASPTYRPSVGSTLCSAVQGQPVALYIPRPDHFLWPTAP